LAFSLACGSEVETKAAKPKEATIHRKAVPLPPTPHSGVEEGLMCDKFQFGLNLTGTLSNQFLLSD
jgi:hypothetical protein